MTSLNRSAVLFVVIYTVAFYAWIFIFRENEWMRLFGANIFPIVGGTVSFIWLLQSYRVITNKVRYFWLLLSLGVLFYLAGNLIFFYNQFILKMISPYPSDADFMWVTAYFLFLVALVFKTKVVRDSMSIVPSVFNILIFMTIATTVSVYYLIERILSHSDYSLGIKFLTIAYPMYDLGFLFAAISLFYLSKHSTQRKLLLLIVAAFSLQIIADSVYVYLSITGDYMTGHFIDPLWQIALLLNGLAALSSQRTEKVPQPSQPSQAYHVKIHDNIFPYVGVLLLLLVLVYNQHSFFNSLNIGVLVVLFLVIMRQFAILKENIELMGKYKHLAYHDPLTGLNNRASFQEDLYREIERARWNHSRVALMSIDLDRFKYVNDTLGHYMGDSLLKAFSYRLQHVVKGHERVYRLGGDEFVILIPEAVSTECTAIAEEIIKESSLPFRIGGQEVDVTPSIGISMYPDHGENHDELFKNADSAMYLAKERGKNNFQFFNTAIQDVALRKSIIERGLRKALEENQFTLHYQPKVELQTKRIIGMEALLRWEHPQLGAVSPGEFIPVAEETGQIVSIGEWVLRTACKQNKAWQEAGFPSLSVSVNVSVRQFHLHHFVKMVTQELKETQLHPQYLELEITESIMQNIKESIEILNALRDLGVKISIDDFGTGYSSLYILKKLPIDTIKIDKSFIDDITDLSNQSMVKSIIDIGQNLNLNVVAEGIESEEQVRVLTKINCNFGQGYIFEKPLVVEDFEKLLVKGRV